MATNQVIVPNPYQQELEAKRNKRKFVEAALQNFTATPQARMAGGVYIPGENAGTALTKILGSALGAYGMKKSQEEEKAVTEQYQKDLEQQINQYTSAPATRETAARAFTSPFPQMQALGTADIEKMRSQDTPLMRLLGGMQNFGGGSNAVPQGGQPAPGAAPMAPPPQGVPLEAPAAPQAGGGAIPEPPEMAQRLYPFLQKPEIITLIMADPTGKLAAQANAERGKAMKLGPEDTLFTPVGVGQYAPAVGTNDAQVAQVGRVAHAREGTKAMYDLAPSYETAQGMVQPTRAQVVQAANGAGIGPRNLGPAQGNQFTPEEFARQYGPLAQEVSRKTGIAPNIILGQWGLETGWGKSVIPGTNNLGNMKDFGGGGVPATDNMTGSRDNYRQFQSPQAFAEAHADLLSRRYPNATGVGGDAQKFAQGIRGYAEDPRYGQKIQAAAATAQQAMAGAGNSSSGGVPGMQIPYNSAQKATDTKSREEDLKFVTAAREQAAKAGESLGAMGAIRNAVKGGSFAGAFGTVQERAAAFADALGLPVDKTKLSNTQYLQSELKRLALPQVKALGFNPTDTDRKFIEEAIGKIATDPAAFDKIIARMEEIGNRDIKKFERMDEYFREKGSLRGFDYRFVPENKQAVPTPEQLGLPPGFKVLRRID